MWPRKYQNYLYAVQNWHYFLSGQQIHISALQIIHAQSSILNRIVQILDFAQPQQRHRQITGTHLAINSRTRSIRTQRDLPFPSTRLSSDNQRAVRSKYIWDTSANSSATPLHSDLNRCGLREKLKLSPQSPGQSLRPRHVALGHLFQRGYRKWQVCFSTFAENRYSTALLAYQHKMERNRSLDQPSRPIQFFRPCPSVLGPADTFFCNDLFINPEI